ncbi:MAG: ankyrin repeat domain-containing protein, partial [Bacteroidales bacterium]|nr:ankyrin repeat domain-containing protein [Bacteroidales bacterium]
SSDRYNASFHTQYDTNDFNDSRIIFYNKELEKYSQEFVNADGMYDIFAADTKRDLALNCIQASLKEHNVSEWIEAGSNFRINARNKYALTEETMIKAKKNSNYMGQHFYDYDLNDVNDIENNIASIWDNNKNKNTCDKLVPASKLFDMFMVRYIPNREETLHSYQQSYTYAKPTGVPNKSFYKKEIDKIIQWLHTLHAKYPNIEQKIAELKIEKAKEAQKLREKKKKKAIERKIELTWLAAEENNLYTGGYYRNVDLNFRNDKGQTPLMLAIENGFIKVIEQFSKGKMDVSLKDNQGKTAFDYIKHATNNEERIESNMMYKALQLLEIKQIIKGKTYIKESSYDENKKIWRIKIKGSKCSTFTFPDYTECDVKKDAVNHPIFKAIKSKDNSSFDRLLTTVDINIKDPWNQSLLWIAMLYHNVYAVDKILENGVDINQSDNMNQSTPLKYALSKKDIELLKILLKYGVDTKSKDKEDIGKMKELLKEGSFFSAE